MVLVEVVRYVGVGTGLVGAFVTAPSETRLLLKDGLSALTTVRRFVLRHVPWYHRSATVHVSSIDGGVAFGGAHVAIHAEGWVWAPDGPVADQIDALRRRTDSLRESITQVRTEHSRRIDDVSTRLDASDAEHRAAITSLRRLHDEREKRGARIDAAGLPLIGLSIVLSGLPDQAVRQAPVSAILLAITAAALILTGVRLRDPAT
jgi:hypothetical protein